MKLGVTDPVTPLNITSVAHQPHRGFWSGAHGGVAPRSAPGDQTQLLASKGLPLRAPLALITIILLLPIQASQMCSVVDSPAARGRGSARDPLPQKGLDAYPGTCIESGDAGFSGWPNPW